MNKATGVIATIVTAATLLVAPQAAQAVTFTPVPQPNTPQGVRQGASLVEVRFERSNRTIARRKPPKPQPPTTNPTPPVTPPSTGGNDFTGWSAKEVEAFNAVNSLRAQNGLKAVLPDHCAHTWARAKAEAVSVYAKTHTSLAAFTYSPSLAEKCYGGRNLFTPDEVAGSTLGFPATAKWLTAWKSQVALDPNLVTFAPGISTTGMFWGLAFVATNG